MIQGNRHYDVNQEILPSVTTILQETQAEEKTRSLAEWKKRVGESVANQQKDEAARRGTALHKFLEFHLREEKILADTRDLTAFIRQGENSRHALNILESFAKIENFLLPRFGQSEQGFHLKQLNEKFILTMTPRNQKEVTVCQP